VRYRLVLPVRRYSYTCVDRPHLLLVMFESLLFVGSFPRSEQEIEYRT